MKTRFLLMLSALVLCASITSAQITISQSTDTGASGSADYGQQFQLLSSESAFSENVFYSLDSVVYYKGNQGGYSGNIYLNIFSQGSRLTDPNFSTNDTSGLDFLGSSNNSVNTGSTSDGAAMTWTFVDVTLETDTNYYAVISSTATSGNYVGRSFSISQTSDTQTYANITASASNALFGGSPSSNSNDNVYTIQVTAVPEPSFYAVLTGLAGICLWLKRRPR